MDLLVFLCFKLLSKMKYIAILFIGFFILSSAEAQWTSGSGIWGGNYFSIFAFDSVSLVAPSCNGIYRKTNGNPEWEQTSGVDFYHDFCKVDSVLISEALNAGYRSFDYGKTWQLLDSDKFVWDIVSTGRNLFASDDDSLYKSSDYGDSWNNITLNTGLNYNQMMSLFAWDTVLVLNSPDDSILMISKDEGETWDSLSMTGIPFLNWGDLGKVYYKDSCIWISTYLGVFRLFEDQSQWEGIDTSVIYNQVFDFHEFRDTLYASFRSKCYYYNPVNSCWISISSGLNNDMAYNLDNWYDTLFLGTEFGLYKLNNDTHSWIKWDDGFNMMDVRKLFTYDNLLYAVTSYNEYVFKSLDNGENFIPVDSSAINTANQMIMTDSLYYIASDYGFNVSEDGGLTWHLYNEGLDNSIVNQIAISNSFYFAATDKGLFRTFTHPIIWERIDIGIQYEAAQNLSVNNSIVIFSAIISPVNHLLLRSYNFGYSFDPLCIDPECTAMTVKYFEPFYYAYKNTDTMYCSSQGAVEWNIIKLPDSIESGSTVRFTAENNVLVLWWNEFMGKIPFIAVTDNYGKTWTYYQEGLPYTYNSSRVHFVEINKTRLIASSYHNGFWYRDDVITDIKTPEVQNADKISVYPNPFRDQITIKCDNINVYKILIKIYDNQGRVVLQQSFNDLNSLTNMKLDNIAPGVYFINLISGENVYSAKIIKK